MSQDLREVAPANGAGVWKTVLAAGGVAASIVFAAGRVTHELETMSKTMAAQGSLIASQEKAIQELSMRVVRLEESLRVYQAWPGQPSK